MCLADVTSLVELPPLKLLLSLSEEEIAENNALNQVTAAFEALVEEAYPLNIILSILLITTENITL
jgi:hypothetical protein